jgi:hypothetical protein
MSEPLRIMCVHGLGDHRQSGWEREWRDAVTEAVGPASGVDLDFNFVAYDPIFERTQISFTETLGAFFKLASSGIGATRRGRGLNEITDRLRWTAGYVVAWLEDEGFQAETRKLLLGEVSRYRPHVVLAHSLGSLVTYDAFSHKDAAKQEVAQALAGLHYVTLGSQIGNPFILGNLTHGRVKRLAVRHWHHLYNVHDDVFTAPLRVQGIDNFSQLLTPFDLPGQGDHSAAAYLMHGITRTSFWSPLVDRASRRTRGGGAELAEATDPWNRAPARALEARLRRKALLIGIEDYPNEADRLAGCVNDVFAMSATLQDCGFEPEQIRICLNERATTEGILSRIEWLVEGAQSGDELVFFYAGHGARVPEYGELGEPDHLTETLVPYDFDWTPSHMVSDDQIYEFYAQLPYGTQLLMVIDCCHSGSMHRQGAARARGITPPDDIRHRELKWDRDEQMWVERDFDAINPDFSRRVEDERAFFGRNLATVRLGRAAPLRIGDIKNYETSKKASAGPVGPFLPLIIEACAEEEFSYEYRHGVTSYGAFTFCFTSILRQEKDITFKRLVELTAERLEKLGYKQTPQILGPEIHINAKVPFETGGGRKEPAGDLPGAATPRTSG